MKRRILWGALSSMAFLCILFGSCGLSNYIYLYPPRDFSSSAGSPPLALTHDIQNYNDTEGSSQSFKGYEIYYRAYSSSSEAETDIENLTVASSRYADSPASFISYAENLSFLRMLNSSTAIPPLISITNPSTEAQYYIYLNAASDWTLLLDSTQKATLVRNISESSRGSFYLKSNYKSIDADYEGADSPSTVYFVFFAVAYGSNPDSVGEEVYSAPVIIDTDVTYTPSS